MNGNWGKLDLRYHLSKGNIERGYLGWIFRSTSFIFFTSIFEITSWVGHYSWNREWDPWEQQQRAGTNEMRSWLSFVAANCFSWQRVDNCLVGLWWVYWNALSTGEYQVKFSSALVDWQGMRSRGRNFRSALPTLGVLVKESSFYHSSWHWEHLLHAT